MRAHRVRALLMGGQACVFYGAAEFSRDTDFAIVADVVNLARLRQALAELQAAPIAVPPFAVKFLRRGHAIHFRCQHPEALRMRVDVMSKMRGVDAFAKLWRRRTTIELPDGTKCDLLSLPDLVQAKKTQRDKDWPMIRRLDEAHYDENQNGPNDAMIQFWMRESRTPEMLSQLMQRFPESVMTLTASRPWLSSVESSDFGQIEKYLRQEEKMERVADEAYWKPLKEELVQLRLNRERQNKD